MPPLDQRTRHKASNLGIHNRPLDPRKVALQHVGKPAHVLLPGRLMLPRHRTWRLVERIAIFISAPVTRGRPDATARLLVVPDGLANLAESRAQARDAEPDIRRRRLRPQAIVPLKLAQGAEQHRAAQVRASDPSLR